MCGILGVLGVWRGAETLRPRVLERVRRLRHRGPDWSGVYCKDKNILAHERLAIVDVESGDQPLFNSSRSLALAVNGEIYNHKLLRSTLVNPTPFMTQSDCEIIIHLYEQHGADSDGVNRLLNALNGIFAFILLDESTGDYVIARDHMGIVPLYIGRDAEGSLWIASEMKALSDICVTFEDFPPGHYMTRKGDKVPWYTPLWHDEAYLSEAPLDLDKLRTGLEAAVRRQLMSDVPYGVLLSGGLDSSLIAAIAARICANRIEDEGKSPAWWPRLHSFSVGLRDSPDLKMARVVAQQINTVHHEFVFTVQEGLDAISSVIYHLETYDVTTIRAATPMFLMSRKIKCLGVKMVLSGEGSDEMFGGYLYFHRCPNREEMQRELVRKLKGLYKFDCVAAGTPVALADGRSVPIETVLAGDKVLALSSAGGAVPRAVEALVDKGVADCVELLLIDGRKLVLTSDHLVRTPTGWRAAGTVEVGVDRLLCGGAGPLSRDPVARNRDGGAWQLAVSDSLSYNLDMVTRREETLAFARICGYILTDGCVAADGEGIRAGVFLGHTLDVKAFQSDVMLLAGRMCEVGRRKRTFGVWLPKSVAHALVAVGMRPGRRVACVTHFPAYVLHADCPVEVAREFLGGLMGGDGRTVALGRSGTSQSPQLQSLAFITSRRGTVAHAQAVALQAELCMLLERCGVATAGTAVFVNTGVTSVTAAGREEVKRRKKLGMQLSQKVDVTGALLADVSYRILIDFPAAMTLPFADKVGFRYCCHKVMRLTAAAGYYRAAQLIHSQRVELAEIAKASHIHRVVSVSDALEQAKLLLGEVQLLHPAVIDWQVRKVGELDRWGPNSNSFTVSVALESFGLRGVFSDFRTAERYNAAAREREIEELLARASAEASEDSSADSDADEEPAGDKVRYGVQAGAQELPLFAVLVVGRRPVGSRRVFDLAVPAPTTDGDVHSFLANGVVVHNCLRANKSTAAWGVEARVPFLDREFLDFVMNDIDPRHKLCGRSGDGRMEKYILRKAFEGYLPDSILWRQKEQMCVSSSTLVAMADGTSLRADRLVRGDMLVGQDGAVVRVVSAEHGKADVMWRIHSGREGASYDVTENHRVVLHWSVGPTVFIRKPFGKSHKNSTLMVAYFDRDTLEEQQRVLATCMLSDAEVSLELPRAEKYPTRELAREEAQKFIDGKQWPKAQPWADEANHRWRVGWYVDAAHSKKQEKGFPWSDKKFIVADTAEDIRGAGWELWSKHEENARALLCGDLVELTPQRLHDLWGRIIAGGRTLAQARFTDLHLRVEKRTPEIWRCLSCGVVNDMQAAACVQCAHSRVEAVTSPEESAGVLGDITGRVVNSAAAPAASAAAASASSAAAAAAAPHSEIDHAHVAAAMRVVELAEQLAEGVVVNRFTVLALPDGDYRPIRHGDRAQVVYMLHNPLQQSTAMTEQGEKATTFINLEAVWTALGLPLGTQSGVVITELNPIIAPTGALVSANSKYDTMCSVNMLDGVLIGLQVTVIIAFGDHCRKRWRKVGSLPGVTGVQGGFTPDGVEYTRFTFIEPAASAKPREVTVWHSTHPCVTARMSDMAAAVAAAHGMKAPDVSFQDVSKMLSKPERIDKAGQEYVAVEVDGNHRFALASGVLTHNSDGVGYSWIDSIKARAEQAVSDEEYVNRMYRFPINTPATKEAYYIRSIFDSHFPHTSAALCVPGGPSVACSTSAAILWDASFQQMADCSGRSVAGVHVSAYDDSRRKTEAEKGGQVEAEQLQKIAAQAPASGSAAVQNGSS